MKYLVNQKRVLIIFLLSTPMLLQAQIGHSENTADSLEMNNPSKNIVDKFVNLLNIKQIAGKEIRDKFPSTRFFDLQYEQVLPTDYKTKLYDEDFESGRLQNQQRLRVALNVPIFKKNAWTITGSARYNMEAFDFKNIENTSSSYPQTDHNNKEYTHFFLGALSSTYFSRLFDKTVIYNLTVSADASNEIFGRVTASAMATMVLKSNENTTITAGIIGIIDNRSPIPVLPIFTLDHKLSNSWSLDIVVPKYAYIRKSFFVNGRLSLGMDFDAGQYYVNSVGYTNSYYYTKNELKTGFMYEHHMSKKLIITLKGGALNTFGGKMMPKGKSPSHDILKSSQNMTGYFNIGFSYNL